MASSIFGTLEENPPSWAKAAGAKSSGGREDPELSGPQRRNFSEASSGDFLDLKGEGDIHENVKVDLQASLGQSEEKPVPATPMPSPVALARCHPGAPPPPLLQQVQPGPGLAWLSECCHFVCLFPPCL